MRSLRGLGSLLALLGLLLGHLLCGLQHLLACSRSQLLIDRLGDLLELLLALLSALHELRQGFRQRLDDLVWVSGFDRLHDVLHGILLGLLTSSADRS
jgi:hypothetical protein